MIRAGPEGTLAPVPEGGVEWLHLLSGLGLGACLADDMGLGKTIQVLSLLIQKRKSTERKPSLLVARHRCWPTGRRRSSASPPT